MQAEPTKKVVLNVRKNITNPPNITKPPNRLFFGGLLLEKGKAPTEIGFDHEFSKSVKCPSATCFERMTVCNKAVKNLRLREDASCSWLRIYTYNTTGLYIACDSRNWTGLGAPLPMKSSIEEPSYLVPVTDYPISRMYMKR